MIETSDFLVLTRLDATDLETWIEAGWLLPQRDNEALLFSEMDVARAALIRDLKGEIGVNDEGVGIVLDLIDQVHGLRRMMRELLSSIDAQPPDMRSRIVAVVREAASKASTENARNRRGTLRRGRGAFE
jgi:chaperone modulatory protein CbpM